MPRKSPSAMRHVMTSLKVAALVTVLGTVVLAAERHLATQVSPEEVIVTDMAPARIASPATPRTVAPATEAPAPAPYFPSQFPEPTSEPAVQPPTF
jgi:hypothetical protein